MNIQFAGQDHLDFYRSTIAQVAENYVNGQYKALVYALGLNPDCRNHIDRLFDFTERMIIPEGLNDGWQTSGSRSITLLAFNLWNGFPIGISCDDEDKEDKEDQTFAEMDATFDGVCSRITPLLPYVIEAIKLRFNYQEIQLVDVLDETGAKIFSGVREEIAELYTQANPSYQVEPVNPTFADI